MSTTAPQRALADDQRDGMEPPRYRRVLEGLVGVPATEGNRIEVLRNGDQIFPAMLEAIASARSTIDFLTFVYWTGEIGTAFADALAERAGAGVRVRVLLDAVGARPIRKDLVARLADAGCEVRWFRPISRLHPSTFNHRTHRKIMVVDEEVSFTGGVGIADVWRGDARHEGEWRDTHFRIEGPATDGLRAAFVDNWAETDTHLFDPEVDRFPEQEQPGGAVIQVVRGAAEPGWNDISTAYRGLLQLATRCIRIATAYFVPDDDLRRLLREAAERGVEVDVLLPGPHADKRFVQLAGEAVYDELLASGVRIHCFQPSMLHAKLTMIDGTVAVVGSANLNNRSQSLDEEVDLVVFDEALTRRLDADFDDDLDRSVQIHDGRWSRRSLVQRGREQVARAVAPFL